MKKLLTTVLLSMLFSSGAIAQEFAPMMAKPIMCIKGAAEIQVMLDTIKKDGFRRINEKETLPEDGSKFRIQVWMTAAKDALIVLEFVLDKEEEAYDYVS